MDEEYDLLDIDGIIEIPKEMNISTDEFSNMFIEWLESKGFFFGGGIKPYESAEE